MALPVEQLLRRHEDPDDELSRKSLFQGIREAGLALQSSLQLRRQAAKDDLAQYSMGELRQHYTNHRRQYQQFFEMYHGKKRISEGEVMATVYAGSRRNR